VFVVLLVVGEATTFVITLVMLFVVLLVMLFVVLLFDTVLPTLFVTVPELFEVETTVVGDALATDTGTDNVAPLVVFDVAGG
jgi:hypothetical protein